jgi:hypothetical protein
MYNTNIHRFSLCMIPDTFDPLRLGGTMKTIAYSGFDLSAANEAALRTLASRARAAGLSPVLTDLLADDAQPLVARVRAYSILGRKLTFTA